MFQPNENITHRIVETLQCNVILTTTEIAKQALTTRATAKKHLLRLVRDDRASMFRIGHSDAWTMNIIPAASGVPASPARVAGAQDTSSEMVADAD